MSYLGWFLAVGGLCGVIFGIRMMLKAKKMTTVPFKKPSEIAAQGPSAADQQGLISTEGQVVVGENLVAPMSGQPCLAYKIEVERRWEKSVQTEKGVEKKTGKESIFHQYKGSVFSISDGAGAINIDANKEPDVKFEKGHTESHSIGMMIPGTLQFGQMQFNVPHLSHDARTTHLVGTEYVLKVSPSMYALGQLQGSTIAEPQGALSGKMHLSTQGREHLLKTTNRNMLLGYIIGGVVFVGGTTLGILGPKPAPGNGCKDQFADITKCDGRIYNRDGVDYKWTVTKAGDYSITVRQPKVKFPIDGTLTLFDATGKQVAYNDGGSPGADAKIVGHFEPGTYKLNVRDYDKMTVSGGFGFNLDVAPVAEAAVGGTNPGAEKAAAVPEVCQQAKRCCEALGGQSDSCASYLLPQITEQVCENSMKGFHRAAKHNHKPAVKAACN